MNDFDRVAWVYDALAFAVFGGQLREDEVYPFALGSPK